MRILIPEPAKIWSLTPDSIKNTADPDPDLLELWSLIPALFRPLIPDPVYLVMTLKSDIRSFSF